jgi:hypothetical protein
MHVDAEVAQKNPRVVLGMFLVNSTPASVLFDSGASHSFITSQFVAQHNMPINPMPRCQCFRPATYQGEYPR